MPHLLAASMILLCIALGLPNVARALPPVIAGEKGLLPDSYISSIWDADSGMPNDKVCALTRTRDGYLWLGTPAGLVRFDGVRFEVYDHLNTPLLKNSRILSLYEDAEGVLWIGTDGGGLYSYGDGEWRSFGGREGLMSNHVRAITGDRLGNLWVGTEYGLHQLNEKEVRIYGLDEGLADNLITAVAADSLGRLWVGTMRGGLARFEGGSAGFELSLVQIYDFNDGLGDLTVLSLAVGPGDRIWIGTMNGLYHLDPDEGLVRLVARKMLYPVTSLAAMPGGGLLIGTMVEGLEMLEGSNLRELLTDEELSDSYVCAVLQDRDGFVWIGTEKSGLVQLKERIVGAIASPEGLPAGSIYPLLEDDDGTLWIGTEKSGLYRMRGDRLERASSREEGLAGNMVRVLMRDRSGALWVGTMDGGLSIIAGGRIRNLKSTDGLSSDNVTAILQDGKGGVWIGTDRGLCSYINGRVDMGGAARTLEGLTIRTLLENTKGVLYAGTRNGVWRFSGSSFERIVAGSDTTTFDALSLYEDSGGTLWAGSNGGGLKRLVHDGAATFTTADGLPGNFIFSIMESDTGLLWMSCENGVFSISRDSLSAYAEGAMHILSPTLYDDSDGMPSARCSGFCQPASCESRFATRLYPTAEGIAVLDSSHEPEPSHPPVVRIEAILADDVSIHVLGNARPESAGAEHDATVAELPPGTDRIEIRFTAFDYSAPQKLRFLYKLGGHDIGFTALHPGGPRRAVYRDLPPGEYEFRVRAITGGGLWSEHAVAARFIISPPFHRTRAFLLLVIAGVLVASGSAAIISRYRRIRKQRMKYSTTSIDVERMERAMIELRAAMEEERIFLDPDLTLQKLARRLKIHYNHLSRIINERFGTSFNNYLNQYRVEEAKRRLADPAEKDRNILEIMYDVGFYSKSTFNTAFKKFTGESPSEYRKKHR